VSQGQPGHVVGGNFHRRGCPIHSVPVATTAVVATGTRPQRGKRFQKIKSNIGRIRPIIRLLPARIGTIPVIVPPSPSNWTTVLSAVRKRPDRPMSAICKPWKGSRISEENLTNANLPTSFSRKHGGCSGELWLYWLNIARTTLGLTIDTNTTVTSRSPVGGARKLGAETILDPSVELPAPYCEDGEGHCQCCRRRRSRSLRIEIPPSPTIRNPNRGILRS
jgi:hypothetical protein